jgi:hypothetical protein
MDVPLLTGKAANNPDGNPEEYVRELHFWLATRAGSRSGIAAVRKSSLKKTGLPVTGVTVGHYR